MAKTLGSARAKHTSEGRAAVQRIEYYAKRVIESIKEGKCTAASLNYADMREKVGEAKAHMRAGGSVWIPATTLQEASVAFNERCVIPVVADSDLLTPLSGARRRRRRR